jgi:hypothetical protein
MGRKRSTYYSPARFGSSAALTGFENTPEFDSAVTTEVEELWGVIQRMSDRIDELEKQLVDFDVSAGNDFRASTHSNQ